MVLGLSVSVCVCHPRLQGRIPTGSVLCRHCFKRSFFPKIAKTEGFLLPAEKSAPFLSAGVQLYACIYFLRAICTRACTFTCNGASTPASTRAVHGQ